MLTGMRHHWACLSVASDQGHSALHAQQSRDAPDVISDCLECHREVVMYSFFHRPAEQHFDLTCDIGRLKSGPPVADRLVISLTQCSVQFLETAVDPVGVVRLLVLNPKDGGCCCPMGGLTCRVCTAAWRSVSTSNFSPIWTARSSIARGTESADSGGNA